MLTIMDIEITLKNYRCFSEANPARFRLRDGFTAFIGLNNAGKSTVLKFFSNSETYSVT
jgi:AAA15 family ATPase/GTPase